MQPTFESSSSSDSHASGTPGAFALPSSITMDTIEALAGSLKQSPMLQSGVAMIDASKVELMTTPGVQLMISTAKVVEQNGGLFLVIQPKAAFSQSFKDLGLGTWLTQREAS